MRLDSRKKVLDKSYFQTTNHITQMNAHKKKRKLLKIMFPRTQINVRIRCLIWEKNK